jgi:two-component system, NarL family, response regulator LiaR
MINVIIADNQDITKFGLYYILGLYPEGISITEVSDIFALKEQLGKISPSLIIIDYNLFIFNSIEELITLQEHNKSNWIIFSDTINDEVLKLVNQRTHAFSFLMKNCTIDEINIALKESIKGNRYICNYVSNYLIDNSLENARKNRKLNLTFTEQEILKELALGKTTKEIAAKRYVSSHTIMTHRKNIFRKIGVNNVHEATKYAMRAGIVDLAEYYI